MGELSPEVAKEKQAGLLLVCGMGTTAPGFIQCLFLAWVGYEGAFLQSSLVEGLVVAAQQHWEVTSW